MEIIAAISGQSVLNAFIWIVVGGLCYFLLNWALDKIALAEPFNKVARVVLVLLVVVVLINGLLGLTGNAFIRW